MKLHRNGDLAPGASSDAPPCIGTAAFIKPTREDAARNGRLVLVAEDNPINRDLISLQLAILGVALDVVADGRLAFELWQSGDYALVLTDLQMPTMDGHALTAAIRGNERGERRIPIVALSADPSQSEEDYCRTLGMDGYLTKPVPLGQLKATLEQWLPVASADAPAASAMGAAEDATGVVDIAVLTSLIGNDPVVILDFLHSFQVGARAIALKLESACLRSDAAEARGNAHKLMSSARSVGARGLGDICAKMADAGKTGDTQALSVLWPAFEQEFNAVNARLDELQT